MIAREREVISEVMRHTNEGAELLRALGTGERPYSRNVALAITALEEVEDRLRRAWTEDMHQEQRG